MRRRRVLPAVALLIAMAGLVLPAYRGLAQQNQPQSLADLRNKAKTISAAASKVVFCVFGECRPAGDRHRLAIVERLARAMAHQQPQVVLGTGDYIDGGTTVAQVERQYEDFLQALDPLQNLGLVAVAAAPGKHDVAGGHEALFTRYFHSLYYSFNVRQCHFVILDTEQGGLEDRIEGAQWQWLGRDLAAALAARRLTFVALYRPLFPVGPGRGSSQDRYPIYRDRLHSLFVQYRVKAVFAGYEALFNEQQRDGVQYFITGGGGAPLDATPANGGFYHYLKVVVTGQKYIVYVQRLNGSTKQ